MPDRTFELPATERPARGGASEYYQIIPPLTKFINGLPGAKKDRTQGTATRPQ